MEGRKRRMQKGRDDSKDYSNIQRAGIPTDEMWLDSGSLFGGVRRSPKTPIYRRRRLCYNSKSTLIIEYRLYLFQMRKVSISTCGNGFSHFPSSAMYLLSGGRLTRRKVIENSADAFP